MRIFFTLLSLAFVLSFSFALPVVHAAEEGVSLAQLAQCSGPDCSACNVVYMANGLIKWLIGISFLLFAVLLTVAGVKLVTSGGNSHTLDEAKSSFTNAIIGLIIILSAWLIVDTIMRGLVGNEGKLDNGGDVSGWLFWSEVTCQTQTKPDKFKPYVEEYFAASGANSYQAYVYNTTGSCKQVSNASFPDIGMCQNALSSVTRSGQVYVVQDCSGVAGSAEPSWMSAPVCGVNTSVDGGMTLSLKGGGNETIKVCDASSLETINFLGGSVQINKHLIPSAQRIDSRWKSRGGDSFYNVTSVGGFNCRKVAGSSQWSVHAYGLAIDINPVQNPYGSTLITNMPLEFRNILTDEGWGWGGNWRSSKDAMHFSKAANEQGNMMGE